MLPYRRVPVASPLPLGPLFDGEPIARPPASRRTGLCRPRAIRGRGTNHGPQTRRRGLRYQRRTADPKAGSALPTTDRRPEGGVCSYQRRTADPRVGSALHYYVGFIPYLKSRHSSETSPTKLSVLFSLA